jgi:hypothetical protein
VLEKCPIMETCRMVAISIIKLFQTEALSAFLFGAYNRDSKRVEKAERIVLNYISAAL